MGIDGVRPWDISVDVMRQSDINVDPFGRPALRPFDDVKVLENKAADIFRQGGSAPRRLLRDHAARGLVRSRELQRQVTGRLLHLLSGRAAALRADERSRRRRVTVDTLLHEMGHAFHTFEVFRSPALPYHQLQDYPTEFAEVASMSMELLGSPYLPSAEGGFYTEEEMSAGHDTRTSSNWCCSGRTWAVVDGFQHWGLHPPRAGLQIRPHATLLGAGCGIAS